MSATAVGILTGILLLSVLMFIHELGHYITGRLLGFHIIEFSLFMGPVLLSKTSKKTGIKYSLKLLPIGASVRFEGEEGMGEEASNDPNAFNNKEKWKRAVVIATGPIVNIVAGILALFLLFSAVGFTTTTVGEVAENSQAAAAGFQLNDRIVSINGSPVWTSVDYFLELGFVKENKPVPVKFVRTGTDGKKETIIKTLTPVKKETYRLGITTNIDSTNKKWNIVQVDPESNGGKPVLQAGDLILAINGVSSENYEKASSQISGSEGKPVSILISRDGNEMTVTSTPSIYEYYSSRGLRFYGEKTIGGALTESFKYSASIVKLTFKSIGKIFTGEIAAKDSLSGPVGVVDIVSTVVTGKTPITEKLANLVWMFALISLNLGIFNLLPIPALDGSHLLLIAVEAIRRKRLSQKVENVIVIIGFLLIIGLALLGLVFDIMRISSR